MIDVFLYGGSVAGGDAMMTSALSIVALGFFLGMRHAVDADHVIAVATIVSRHRDTRRAALTGMFWGVGHTLTVIAVGAVIIVFNVIVPARVSLGMELAVGVVLIVLGVANIRKFSGVQSSGSRAGDAPAGGNAHTHDHDEPRVVHVHAHGHGDYVHSHPHGHDPDRHPHSPDQTPLASVDRVLGRFSLYANVRPLVVGIVHGLAGSSAVALLVLSAIRDPWWAAAYLLVFGLGTIAGMMLVTMTMASAFRLAPGGSTGRIGFVSGVASVAFGVFIAYQIFMVGL